MSTSHHRRPLLVDLPPEIQELIFRFTIGSYDDITNDRRLARSALQTLTTLRLTSRFLLLSTPFLHQTRLQLHFLLSPYFPSLAHLFRHTSPALAFPYLTLLSIPSLDHFRSEFLPPTSPSNDIHLLHLPALHEVHLSLGTLHFPSRHRLYWSTPPRLRSQIKSLITHAVLTELTSRLTMRAHATHLTIRFNLQYDMACVGMESLIGTAVPHVYFTIGQLFLGGGRWRETSHQEVLHVHAREERDGLWGLKLVPGLCVFYGSEWIWRKTVEERVVVSEREWGCVCFGDRL